MTVQSYGVSQIKWFQFELNLDDKVGAVIPYASDSNIMVVAVANRLVKYDSVKREVLETLVDVTNHEKNVRTRINDAKCDPYGRILFG